ncbi:MAG: folate-binding protein YgfZ [Gammaproteobacteria bacterium]|nr:folate-binding protein YgfZ [Gammaproteobacteria bacterium]
MSSTIKPAIIDLSHLGWLKITGSDAKKFLQGQLTCNMEEVSISQSRLGAHCNPKGRIISLFKIFYFNESYYLQMPREMVSIALNALKKYAVFFKVVLSDASNELVCLGYFGYSLDFAIFPPNQDEIISFNNLLISKVSDNRYELIGNVECISELKKQISHAEILSINDWKYQDITVKIPQVYPETSEKFLPHELNLHLTNGISFNKGCYTGQEIIARMHYRGQLKTQLQCVTIDSNKICQRGEDLLNTQDIIVDMCKNGSECVVLIIQKTL